MPDPLPSPSSPRRPPRNLAAHQLNLCGSCRCGVVHSEHVSLHRSARAPISIETRVGRTCSPDENTRLRRRQHQWENQAAEPGGCSWDLQNGRLELLRADMNKETLRLQGTPRFTSFCSEEHLSKYDSNGNQKVTCVDDANQFGSERTHDFVLLCSGLNPPCPSLSADSKMKTRSNCWNACLTPLQLQVSKLFKQN